MLTRATVQEMIYVLNLVRSGLNPRPVGSHTRGESAMGLSQTTVPPVIEAWSTYRTASATQWTARQLRRAKGGARVSVVIPARDEESTVGDIVATIREHLVKRVPLVDEVIVVDSRSSDTTARVAAAAGARVVCQDAMTRGLPRLDGKGDALWAGL